MVLKAYIKRRFISLKRLKHRRYILKKNKAEKIVKVLDTVLKLEANSASCVFAYEPKAPKELERFKKTK